MLKVITSVIRLQVSEKEIIWLVLETKMSNGTLKMKWSPRSWTLRTTSGLLLLPLSRLGRKSSESKSECDSYSLVGSSSMTSLSNVTKLFPSSGSSSRTSFSSISSTISDSTSSSGSEKLENKRKKSWSVLKIIDH